MLVLVLVLVLVLMTAGVSKSRNAFWGEFVNSGSPQPLKGKAARSVATLSINSVAAKRNRQEGLNAEHKACGNSALRKSIAGLIEWRLRTVCCATLRFVTVYRANCDGLQRKFHLVMSDSNSNYFSVFVKFVLVFRV